MVKSISQHPLIKMAPSQWAKLCDARRMYEIRKTLREAAVKCDNFSTTETL
jgi:hypothetical protein